MNTLPNKNVLPEEVLRTFAQKCKWLAGFTTLEPGKNVLAPEESLYWIYAHMMYPPEMHNGLNPVSGGYCKASLRHRDVLPYCGSSDVVFFQNPDNGVLSRFGYMSMEEVLAQLCQNHPTALGFEIREFPLVGLSLMEIVRKKEENQEKHGGYIPFTVRLWTLE